MIFKNSLSKYGFFLKLQPLMLKFFHDIVFQEKDNIFAKTIGGNQRKWLS
jgi:hypothetical protein